MKSIASTHGMAEPVVRLTSNELDILIGQYRGGGSDNAFARLHEELTPYIWAIVFAWLDADLRAQEGVEDACQTVWMRLAEAARRTYTPGNPSGFRPFARKVAINVCKDLNGHRRLPFVEAAECGLDDGSSLLEQVPDSRPNQRDKAAVAETARGLRKAVEAMSPMHRHLMRLAYPGVFADGNCSRMRQPPTVLSRGELARAMEAKFGESFSVSRIKDMKSRAVALLRQAMLRQKGGRRRVALSGRPGIPAHRPGAALAECSLPGMHRNSFSGASVDPDLT
jgi:RNA polymerase sigma factor (sigma-70 family)